MEVPQALDRLPGEASKRNVEQVLAQAAGEQTPTCVRWTRPDEHDVALARVQERACHETVGGRAGERQALVLPDVRDEARRKQEKQAAVL